MRILNYGSLNIDYVFSVERAAEPGQSIAVESPVLFAGGKGLNQSVAAARAGGSVFHAGKIGPEGRFLVDTLNAAGVDTGYIVTDPSLMCGGAYIQVEPSGRNTMLIAGGANRQITEGDIKRCLSCFGAGDVLMLQNETNLTREMAFAAHESGMRIVYNPSPVTRDVFSMPYELIDLLIVNEDEGATLTGCTEPDTMLDALVLRGSKAAVLTLGGRGSIGERGRIRARQYAYKAAAIDTTGAGDTYAGYLAQSFFSGASLADAMDTASRAAAIAVTRRGAAASIPTASEVAAYPFEKLS